MQRQRCDCFTVAYRSAIVVGLLDEVRRFGDPLGRHRTHDAAPAGLDPDLVKALESDDAATRTAAVDALERRIAEDADDEIDVVGNGYTRIPDGIYRVVFRHHQTAIMFGSPRVFMIFEVCGGAHAGKRIFAAYRVRDLIGKPCRAGRFTLGARQKLFLLLARLAHATRADRVTTRSLRDRELLAKVRTVTTGADGHEIAECARYSAIADLWDEK